MVPPGQIFFEWCAFSTRVIAVRMTYMYFILPQIILLPWVTRHGFTVFIDQGRVYSMTINVHDSYKRVSGVSCILPIRIMHGTSASELYRWRSSIKGLLDYQQCLIFSRHGVEFLMNNYISIVFYVKAQDPGGWLNIMMPSYQYRKSHRGDKTIVDSI